MNFSKVGTTSMRPEDPQPPVPTQRSPYWAEPCTKVFAVKGLLYQIDIAKLAKDSEFFRNLLHLQHVNTNEGSDPANAVETPTDGTVENPIFLNEITTEQWESFLRYSENGPWNPSGATMNKNNLVDLLWLADRFIMPGVIAHAVENLKKLGLSPYERLGLGLRFGIMPWINPAAREILRRVSLLDASYGETVELGRDMIFYIAKAELALDRERRIIACRPPTFRQGADEAPYCPNHDQCLKTLNDTWRNIVAPRIIHPSKPLLLQKAEAFVVSLRFEGMKPQCKTYMTELIRRNNGFMRGYRVIQQRLIDDLRGLMYHLPLVEDADAEDSDDLQLVADSLTT